MSFRTLLPGRAYRFLYPSINFKCLPQKLNERRMLVTRIRDTESEPLEEETLASNPWHESFRQRAQLTDFPYVLSAALGMQYRVSKLPHAVLVDEAGRVRAKGLVNSREQLDSLFVARDLGVGSVQEYLDQPRFAKETT